MMYLSLTELAFAKQSQADLTRIIKKPGIFTAIGYWLTSEYASVSGILPRISVPGLIDITMIDLGEWYCHLLLRQEF